MPNHIKNRLTFSGDQKVLDFIFACISGSQDDDVISFEKILPLPAFCFNKSAGSEEEKMAELLGIPIWTKVNRHLWGTKWGAYEQKKTGNVIEFETAWAAPFPVINEIAKRFPMIKMKFEYADEDTGYNCGVIEYEDRMIKSKNIPTGGTKEAYDLAFQLRPENMEYYELIDGEWKGKED